MQCDASLHDRLRHGGSSARRHIRRQKKKADLTFHIWHLVSTLVSPNTNVLLWKNAHLHVFLLLLGLNLLLHLLKNKRSHCRPEPLTLCFA